MVFVSLPVVYQPAVAHCTVKKGVFMILATWQPLVENNDKANRWPELTGYLGYKPIFCFSSENEMSFIIGSAFSKPSLPERLIIFESYEYRKINKILWDRRQAEIALKGKSKISFIDCFNTEGVSNYAIEYIVKGVNDDELIIDIPLDHMLDGGITSDYEDIQTMTNATIQGVQAYCKDIFARTEEALKIKREDISCDIKKSIVQWTLAPLWYSIAVENSVIPTISITYEDVILYKVLDHIAEYLDPKNLETKESAFYDKICKTIRNKFLFFDFESKDRYYRPQPNELCLCGSKMKYKHCCGKSY